MSRLKDVNGEVYGRYTIIGNAPSVKYGTHRYKRVIARCECGNERELTYRDLKRGVIKSCGCIDRENRLYVEEGQKFSWWTVIRETKDHYEQGKKNKRKILCKCVCGKERAIYFRSLTKGVSKSCGCLGREKKIKEEKIKIIPQDTEEEKWEQSLNYPEYYISTLGRFFNYETQIYLTSKLSTKVRGKEVRVVREMYRTFIGEYDDSIFYVHLTNNEIKLENLVLKEVNTTRAKRIRRAYFNIKSRCYNENCKDYINYGGRGIILEECFDTFDKFFDWSINNGYEDNLEIDREDNDGNYSAENCRWTTKANNTRNRRVSVMNWELVDKIREGEYSEMTTQEVANIIGCSWSTVESVKNFKTWNK